MTSLSISREMPLAELKDKYRKLPALEKARNGWEDEYEVSSKQVSMICYISYWAKYTCLLFWPNYVMSR